MVKANQAKGMHFNAFHYLCINKVFGGVSLAGLPAIVRAATLFISPYVSEVISLCVYFLV